MGILGKELRELQRSDPQGMIEHHEEAERLPAKPTQWTDIVALFETGALPEELPDLLD
jgi:hypothetical protein